LWTFFFSTSYLVVVVTTVDFFAGSDALAAAMVFVVTVFVMACAVATDNANTSITAKMIFFMFSLLGFFRGLSFGKIQLFPTIACYIIILISSIISRAVVIAVFR
jgi:asparagine N-glycosylation enzyme membrane subunit Stt3